jgi:ADP-ribosylglycohydrolase
VTPERLRGSLLGQALGDALGFVVEAEPPEVARAYVEQWLRTGHAAERSHPRFPFGQYSDDTQLSRELLRSYRESGRWDPAAFAGRIAELFRTQRDVGAGRGTRSAALRLLSGVPWSEAGTPAPYAGNGSAMRAGQLGLLFSDPEAVSRAARDQSRITHLDPRCAAGSVAVARAVNLAAAGGPVVPTRFLEEIAQAVEPDDAGMAAAIQGLQEWASYSPEQAAALVHHRGLDPAHPVWRGISAYVIPSVLWSLYAFLRSPDDYWESICTAIGVGGDTDTMAAITGAVSGARVGQSVLPWDLLARLTDRGEWGAAELADLADACAAIAQAAISAPGS